VGENSNIFSYGTRQPKSHQIWPVGRAIFLHDVIRRRDRIEEFGTSRLGKNGGHFREQPVRFEL